MRCFQEIKRQEYIEKGEGSDMGKNFCVLKIAQAYGGRGEDHKLFFSIK